MAVFAVPDLPATDVIFPMSPYICASMSAAAGSRAAAIAVEQITMNCRRSMGRILLTSISGAQDETLTQSRLDRSDIPK